MLRNLKSITSVIAIVTMSAFTSFGQQKLVNGVNAFVPENVLANNRIVVTNNVDANIIPFKISLTRWAEVVDKPFDVQGRLILQIGSIEYPISSEITFSSGDFTPAWGIISAMKDVQVTFQGSAKIGNIRFKYSEKIGGIWNDGLLSAKLYETTFSTSPPPPQPPTTTIIGPDYVCDEGIFEILSDEDVLPISLGSNSIVNFVDLGDRKRYKAIPVPGKSGEAHISAGGYLKKFIVGTPPPKSITAPYVVHSNNEYSVSVTKSDPGSTLNISVTGITGAILQEVSNGMYLLKLPTVGGNAFDYPLQIKASETNPCGTSSEKIWNLTLKGGVGPGT